jgi:hypothetical protein
MEKPDFVHVRKLRDLRNEVLLMKRKHQETKGLVSRQIEEMHMMTITGIAEVKSQLYLLNDKISELIGNRDKESDREKYELEEEGISMNRNSLEMRIRRELAKDDPVEE